VRECFKGDEASQWKKKQNSTPRHAKTHLPIFTKIGRLYYVLGGTRRAKFCSDRFRGFCSPKYVILPCLLMWVVCSLGYSLHPWTDIYAKYVKWRNSGLGSAFWGSRWLYFLLRPLNFQKPQFWGPILTGVFFATENRFNMGMHQYKLPLIVIVAP